jgi:tetratricopeptide (TPR) repeat protein
LPFGLSRDESAAGAAVLTPGSPGKEGALEAATVVSEKPARRKAFLSGKFVLGALLVGLTLAVYAQTCRFDFIILDDVSYVKSNRYVLEGLTPSSIRWAFAKFNDANWIPLTWLSLMLDASIHKNWPDGYHVTNTLLHVANVLLLYTILTRMTQSVGRSAFVAALFAIHPLHVESVAWVTERKDVLCTFFGFLALWAYVSYAEKPRRSRYVAAFCCLTLSLLAKQTFVTLPCVFLLLDYWPLGRFYFSPSNGDPLLEGNGGDDVRPRMTFKQLVVEKIPFFVLVGAFSVIAVVAQMGGGIRSLELFPFRARLLNAIWAYGWYAWKALVPVDLAIFYPHPAGGLALSEVILPAAFLVAATAFALWNLRRRPYLIVGWLWYLGTLFPLIGLIQIGRQRVADRYTYLPLVGLYLAVAWLIPSLVPSPRLRRWLLPTAACGAIAVYAALAFKQVALWDDDVALFEHAIAVAGDNSMCRCSLGCAWLARGDAKSAIPNFQKSIQFDPDDSQSHDDLGSAYQAEKRLEDAAREYRKAIALTEDSASAHEGLGTILAGWHKYEEAKKEFTRAIEIEPMAPMTYYNLARLSEDLKQYDKSIDYAQRGLEVDPKHVECQRQIAHILAEQGHIDEAIEAYQKVAAMSASDLESRLRIRELTDKKREQSSK